MIISHLHHDPIVAPKRSQFTGATSADSVLPATDGVTINVVTFEPGARTFWHRHEHGQILEVLSGYGLVCTAGETPRTLATGDTVWVPAGEVHWHGARPDTFMTHTAISLGSTEWFDEVPGEEYTSLASTEGTTT